MEYKFNIDPSIKNIPDTIRKSVEDNFKSYFKKELSKSENENNSIINRIKAFNRITKRFRGFEGQVVLYHNQNVRNIFMNRLIHFKDEDYSHYEIPEDLYREFQLSIINSLHYCAQFINNE